jgi:peptidoglycan/xylan/chitin deacetylase (PgdA/CDA1 family)
MDISIPILMYHQVSSAVHTNFREYTVTTEAFIAQMKILKRLGFSPITMSELIGFKKKINTLPAKPIIITFDDVLEDTVENTVPVLEHMGFNAVFYVPTEFVGRKSSWMLSDVDVEFQLIDWTRVRDLSSRGFEVGSHTMTHPHMNTISTEYSYRELEESRKILEENLNQEVRHMAYPFGAFDERIRAIVNDAGYYTACTTEPHIANTGDDMLTLPRLNMGMDDNLFDFILKINIAYTATGIYKTFNRRIKNSKRFIPKPARAILKKLLRYTKSS